ncbi:hypothetical protein Ciccas_008236 [Cichlidogyrus casuarinus]|uniref:Uncharacterized protein n=1 Tax=Cichlidogyrus casuarinus TaxID=1844966 RepID=A0ABD2Q122_9PLAT
MCLQIRRVPRSPSVVSRTYYRPVDGYMTPVSSYDYTYERPPYNRYLHSRTPVSSSVMSQSYSDAIARHRLDRKLDDLLDYKLPSADYYLNMRGSLRNLNEKMLMHRQLLDRYSGIDMKRDSDCVSDNVDRKFHELLDR